MKSKILQSIPSNKSIRVDELSNYFSDINWETIDKILRDLIDEEKIDAIEGRSGKRINGKYGRVIRR